jgi:antitoxin (DNA-binding transcriptional repressor) of toxin-antitoxin stability system
VEKGERIVVTENGRPLFDIVPHKEGTGIDLQAGWAYLKSSGIKPVPFIAEDFDEPLPEDFLTKSLPSGHK